MATYCTIDDVKNIVPDSVHIGTNLQNRNTNVTEAKVEYWIEQSASIIDADISSFYRIPLIKYKEADFSENPVTFTEKYPNPIPLINARLTAAYIYDHIMSAQQEPNVSDFAKNQRSLAYDDLLKIQIGSIQLKNQVRTGLRFVRQELHDPSRIPVKEVQPPNRGSGE